MSDASTQKMIAAFFQRAAPTGFLASFFQAPADNFYSSEEVEIDITRNTERVAVPVIDGNGYRVITADQFTNKRFKAPIYKDMTPLRAWDLLSRDAGDNPFADVGLQTKLTGRAMRALNNLMDGMRRAIELQAAQVLQLGAITLLDAAGNTPYTLDFGLAASHKITVGTAWDQAGGDPVADIIAASDVVRDDGKVDPRQVITNGATFEVMIKNSDFAARFDPRRADLGAIYPMRGVGGTGGGNYRGTIDVGAYKVDLWTYDGRYLDPTTGLQTKYIADGKVIIRSPEQRLDATFGNIPTIVTPDRRLLPYLPRRMSSTDRVLDMHVNAWTDGPGETLNLGVGMRPLLIPTQIDGYAVLSGTVTP